MKKSKPTKLLLGFLGIATFASLVGTVSGTLAWYAYSTRATLSYSGTSVNNTVQLQIGIASPTKVMSVQEIRDQNSQIIADNPEMTTEEREELDRIESYFVDFWDVIEETKWNDDSNYYYFAPVGSGLTSPVINAYLEVVITIWVEGWQEFAGSPIWDVNYIDSQFDIGFEFATDID